MTVADTLGELVEHLHVQGYAEGAPSHIPMSRMEEDRRLGTQYLCGGCRMVGLGFTRFYSKGDMLASVYACRVCGRAEVF